MNFRELRDYSELFRINILCNSMLCANSALNINRIYDDIRTEMADYRHAVIPYLKRSDQSESSAHSLTEAQKKAYFDRLDELDAAKKAKG